MFVENKFLSTMKVKARFLILILFTNSISDGTASFKCMSGYKMTQDNEEKVEEFSEKDCNPDVGYDRCYSAKGSLVVEGVKCEFFKTIFYIKILFKCFSNIKQI